MLLSYAVIVEGAQQDTTRGQSEMRMARIFILATISMLLIVGLSACQTTKSPQSKAANISAGDVSGTWIGECFGWCQSTKVILKVKQNGNNLAGTIQTENTPKFGTEEKPILRGQISGRDISFDVLGNTGELGQVRLELSEDGRTLDGIGGHQGGFGLRFHRAPSNG